MYTTKTPRWKIADANWSIYKNNVSLPEQHLDVNDYSLAIINSIANSCTLAIPKTSSKVSNKYCCFWWTPECKLALSNAKRQFRILQGFHSDANLVEYKRLDAIATRTLLEAKSTSWKKYLSTVNKDTVNTILWKVINSLSGKTNSFDKITLNVNNIELTDPADISKQFGEFFSNVSSDNNYNEDFFIT